MFANNYIRLLLFNRIDTDLSGHDIRQGKLEINMGNILLVYIINTSRLTYEWRH